MLYSLYTFKDSRDGTPTQLRGIDTCSFMLCSDGAWEYLKDLEVLVDRQKSSTAKEWTQRMLLRIMDRVNGKNDNLSIVTLIVE